MKLTRFEFKEIPRSEINEAPYNPRVMDAGARKKLRESLKRYGLVEPLVWNRRTGHLVGGHQRLREMDRLMGTKDYMVPVAVVDLDEKEEKELNILLNNPNLMGDYDWAALERLFTQDGVNPFAAGFELPDLALMLGEDTARAVAELFGQALEADPLMGDVEGLAEEAEKILGIKARKREYAAQEKAKDLPENYLLVVYPSAREKDQILAEWGIPPGTRVISAERFSEIVREQLRRDEEE